MKKLLLSIIIGLSLLSGCGQEPEVEKAISATVENQVVTISVQEEQLEVAFVEDQTAMDVMKNNFELEETDGFITSINGRKADESENEFWSFIVNGEPAQVGAGSYELNDGDEILFEIDTW
jgi:TolA-binding protein